MTTGKNEHDETSDNGEKQTQLDRQQTDRQTSRRLFLFSSFSPFTPYSFSLFLHLSISLYCLAVAGVSFFSCPVCVWFSWFFLFLSLSVSRLSARCMCVSVLRWYNVQSSSSSFPLSLSFFFRHTTEYVWSCLFPLSTSSTHTWSNWSQTISEYSSERKRTNKSKRKRKIPTDDDDVLSKTNLIHVDEMKW